MIDTAVSPANDNLELESRRRANPRRGRLSKFSTEAAGANQPWGEGGGADPGPLLLVLLRCLRRRDLRGPPSREY